MNNYQVVISPTAEKEIVKLDQATKKKLDKAILRFYNNPFIANTDKLTNHPEANYRHRIGNWRILFDLISPNTIWIIHVWPRGKDYRK